MIFTTFYSGYISLIFTTSNSSWFVYLVICYIISDKVKKTKAPKKSGRKSKTSESGEEDDSEGDGVEDGLEVDYMSDTER